MNLEKEENISSNKKVMTIDEMISAKESWKRFLKMAKNNLKRIRSIEENKENRWDLKSLEMSYNYFIDQMGKIVSLYSQLVILAQENDMDEYTFKKVMLALQLINKNLHQECNKKSFKALNIKYIESLREAKTL